MKNLLYLVGLVLLLSCRGYSDRVKAEIENPLLPVLTGKTANPVVKINLIRNAAENYKITGMQFSTEGTTNENIIESAALYQSDTKGLIDTAMKVSDVNILTGKMTMTTEISGDKDTVSFWLAVKLKSEIDLNNFISIKCTEIITDGGKIDVLNAPSSLLRTGVALRQQNQDGVHSTRIPGLITSKKGTLLAVYDARYESARDLQGNIDIAVNRSFNGGVTWEPMQIALDMKEWGNLPEKYNGVSDACILSDENTGDLYLAGLWMHGVLDSETGKWVKGMTKDSTRWIHQWQKKGSQPGFDVKQTSQFIISKSTDDGQTWGEPINITAKTKVKEWWLYAPAPGHGITLADGTLLFPTQGRDKDGKPFSNITWSKDGLNWTTSAPAYNDVTECMAVQLSNGAIMLNMRDNRNRGKAENNGRRICVTEDMGKTWTEHPTSRKALIEPTCMGSLHKHVYTKDNKSTSILLFVNPSSVSKRDHITLKVSFDEGMTWPEEHWILLDEYSGRGYSCITSIDNENIGILYESSQAHLVFQRINIQEILK